MKTILKTTSKLKLFLLTAAIVCLIYVKTYIIRIQKGKYSPCYERDRLTNTFDITSTLPSLFGFTSYQKGRICLKNYFKNILLLVNFNEPFYGNIPIIKNLYGNIFPNMVFYGTNKSHDYDVNVVDTHKGYFSYIDVAHAMKRYANYTGYFLINDDVLLNPWNLVRFQQNKIWEGPRWPITIGNYSKFDNWYWWKSRWGLKNCKEALKEVTNNYRNFRTLKQSNRGDNHDNQSCRRGRSDIVYIPKGFSKGFIALAETFHRHRVFLEIAFPSMLRLLQRSEQFETLHGIYMPGRVKTAPVTNSRFLWKQYNERLDFIHPVKLHYGNNSQTNHIILTTLFQRLIDRLTNCTQKDHI